jgi:hypothetical protein
MKKDLSIDFNAEKVFNRFALAFTGVLFGLMLWASVVSTAPM